MNRFLSNPRARACLLLTTFILTELSFLAGAHIGTGVGAVLVTLLISIFLLCVSKNDLVPTSKILNSGVFYFLFTACFALSVTNLIISYYSLKFTLFDTGIFANLQYRIWHTGRYFSSVLEMPGIRDHFTPGLILFSPLLFFWNTFLWLPILKLIAVSSCALILLKLSREIFGTKNILTYLLPILWLFDRHVRYLLLTEFQPSTLALPLVLLCFLFAHRRQTIRLLLCLGSLLLFKENMPFVWLSVGMFMIFIAGSKKEGVAVALGGLAIGLAIPLVLVPWLVGPYTHLSRFSPFELITQKIRVVWEILLALWFLPLFNPISIFFLAPSLLLTLISRDPQMMSFNYHYQDIPITISYVAGILGLARIIKSNFWSSLAESRKSQLIIGVLILLSICNSKILVKDLKLRRPTATQNATYEEIQALREILPKEATVWASNSVGVFFFDRQNLRCIIGLNQFFEDTSKDKYLIVPKDLNPWPLTSDQQTTMLNQAIQMSEKGKLERLDFKKIEVFRSSK